AAANQSYAANYTTAGQGYGSYATASASTSNMNWVVEGDLNEQELNSINKLLGQINQLAGEFFNVNLDVAFNLALALRYDEQQIANFSLSLTQLEAQKVTTVYQTFNRNPIHNLNLAETLLTLGHFIKHLLDGVEPLKDFPEAKNIVTNVAE